MTPMVKPVGFGRRCDGMVVRGRVFACRVNKRDEATAVAILTGDGEEFLVRNQGLGRGLLSHVDDFVQVSGVIREHRNGDTSIEVLDYEVLVYR